MPIWHAEMYSLMSSELLERRAARPSPPSRASPPAARGASAPARTPRRRRTPLSAMSTEHRDEQQRGHRGRRPGEPRYFEEGRRSSERRATVASRGEAPGRSGSAARRSPRQREVGVGERRPRSASRASGGPCSSRARGCRGGGCAPRPRSATRLTNAIAAAKSANSSSRTIASPSRRQPPLARCSSIVRVGTQGCHRSVRLLRVRIVSLVPHATELLFALGLGDEVVGVTHECDYPPEAAELPH